LPSNLSEQNAPTAQCRQEPTAHCAAGDDAVTPSRGMPRSRVVTPRRLR
jgi:hypothetical protein